MYHMIFFYINIINNITDVMNHLCFYLIIKKFSILVLKAYLSNLANITDLLFVLLWIKFQFCIIEKKTFVLKFKL